MKLAEFDLLEILFLSEVIRAQVHCDYLDCENNEDKKYHAVAIRLSSADGCLTYQTPGRVSKKANVEKGDRLLWDREYFEDDPLDDRSAY